MLELSPNKTKEVQSGENGFPWQMTGIAISLLRNHFGKTGLWWRPLTWHRRNSKETIVVNVPIHLNCLLRPLWKRVCLRLNWVAQQSELTNVIQHSPSHSSRMEQRQAASKSLTVCKSTVRQKSAEGMSKAYCEDYVAQKLYSMVELCYCLCIINYLGLASPGAPFYRVIKH